MDGTVKPENECIYYSVDKIHSAIQEKCQITFQYFEYTPKKEKVLKHDGYRYQFSPYVLIWNKDYYYAVGWSNKHGKLAQFRVDRMTAVELLNQTAILAPDFDPAEYVQRSLECIRMPFARWNCCAIMRSCAASSTASVKMCRRKL